MNIEPDQDQIEKVVELEAPEVEELRNVLQLVADT